MISAPDFESKICPPEHLAARAAAIARPLYQGQPGHPVGFAAHYRDALMALHDDTGARNIVAAQRHLLQLIPCDDPAVLLDIDTPTDLAALQNGGLRPPA